jgi:MFS family permease
MRDDDGDMHPADAGAGDRSRRSAERGLDALNLFVANVQTGFGPFLAVYLTTAGWTQGSIGLALSVGTVAAMASQVPAGALVDAVHSKSRVAVFSILAFTASALMFTIAPVPLFVYGGQILHAFSSCTLGPALVALSLAVAGSAAMPVRLGRNARWASIGNGAGAVLMGACGYWISERAVFFLTALLTIPAIAAVVPIARHVRRPPVPERRGVGRRDYRESVGRVLGDRRLLIFAACVLLFTFANAAMLPLAAAAITRTASAEASLLIAACIVLPQAIVAMISPRVGRWAQERGRRPVLLLGFSILPLRGALLAATGDPLAVVAIQVLDGIAAACFGVMLPLVTTDIAARSGHLNLALGFVGFAVGVGATISTAVGGLVADAAGEPAAFLTLAAAGAAAVLMVRLAMPETRPER